MVKVHYTQKSGNETIATGVVKGRTKHSCFFNAMSEFGHCIGAVKENGETLSWVFSKCKKDGDNCQILITHCEILQGLYV